MEEIMATQKKAPAKAGAKATTGGKAAPAVDNLQYVAEIRPGSAAETPLRVIVPSDRIGGSLADIVEYALGQNHPRTQQRIAETIRSEMRGQYGLNVNASTTVTPKTPARDYFTERTVQGTTYMGLDLIIASKQTGGYGN
jgi:hypothetical protein